jgi:hypothetical protein
MDEAPLKRLSIVKRHTATPVYDTMPASPQEAVRGDTICLALGLSLSICGLKERRPFEHGNIRICEQGAVYLSVHKSPLIQTIVIKEDPLPTNMD